MASNLSRTTQDHEVIRKWAEERGGKPSHVKSTGSGEDVGILRIDFPGYSGAGSLEQIGWDEWFEKFDENNLALLYEEETAGGERSNFNKIVKAETAQAAESGRGSSRAKRTSSKGAAKKAGVSKKAAAKKGSQAAKKGAKAASKKTASKKIASKKTSRGASAKKSASRGTNKKAVSGKKAVPRKKSASKKSSAKKRR